MRGTKPTCPSSLGNTTLHYMAIMFSMKQQNQTTFTMSSSPYSSPSSQSSSFSLHSLRNTAMMNKNSRKEMKRRFSDEQIKSLEYSFESESRPDSNVKHEIAGKLELQPRQVSIWFQNRRARLKSKQIEREFGSLKADYDSLASRFESLKKENDLLIVQLQKLKSIQANQNGSRNIEHLPQHNKEESSIIKSEPEDKSGFKVTSAEDNINSRNGEEQEEEGSAGLTEDDSLASQIIRFNSEYFLDESSCSSQWWELWS